MLDEKSLIQILSNLMDEKLRPAVAKISSVGGRLDSMEGQISALGGRIDSVNGQISSLSGHMNAMEGQIGSLRKRMDSTERQIDALQTGIRSLTADTANLKADTEKILDNAKELEENAAILKSNDVDGQSIVNGIKSDMIKILQNTDIIRNDANSLLEWAKAAQLEIKIPLFRRHTNSQ